ncbi:MAG TPA: serine hydrolase [Microscillaceae bacterium]|nr:serine hydrolase [Microscillaceae bacterium]
MKQFTLLIFILILSQVTSQAQSTHKDSLLKEWNKLDAFKKMVQKEVPDFGFYAALIWNGEIISTKKMGYANRETKLPLDEDTIFLWGSISKMFTSIAIVQLIEKGRLNLDDPVIKYVPELGNGVDSLGGMKAIKIHHFLNHNSGINLSPCYDSLHKTYPRFKNSIPSTKEMLLFLKLATQNFTPGKKFQYSNGAYSLLGVIIERITKIKFTKYVTRNIFKLLGMKTAHYGETPRKFSKYFTRAYYQMKNGKTDTMNFDVSQGFQEGNGGVKATVKDMLKFMDFLRFRKREAYFKRYEKVLKKKILDKYYLTNDFSDKRTFHDHFKSPRVHRYWYLGFMQNINPKLKTSLLGHTGLIERHLSVFFFNTKLPLGVLLMCNTSAEDKKTKTALANRKIFSAIYRFPVNLEIDKKRIDLSNKE